MKNADADSALDNYRAVRARVDDFFDTVWQQRQPEDMRCASGCDQCCHVELSLSPIETKHVTDHLQANPELAQSLRARERPEGRCRMLSDDGRCEIYEARPLVCRSQGLPLLYPRGIISAEAIMGRASPAPSPNDAAKSESAGSDVTWCPLNFQIPAKPPAGAEVLDAATVDKMHSLINAKWCAAENIDRLQRFSFAEILHELR